MKRIQYQTYKPLINAFLLGVCYLWLSWGADRHESVKMLFMMLMLFLPGVIFPLTTTYYQINTLDKNSGIKLLFHFVLSIALYHGNVWLSSLEGRFPYVLVFGGFAGSFVYMQATKYLIINHLQHKHILITAVLSGVSFLPFGWDQDFLPLGIGLFLWNVFNGFLLHKTYSSTTQSFTVRPSAS